MDVQIFPLAPPDLDELAGVIRTRLAANFEHSTVSIVECPDLRKPPFHLATQGLSGHERIADIGGQPNLFPRPQLDTIWSMPRLAQAMDMSSARGSFIGAGAGPFHVVGQNCELAANLSWKDGFDNVDNQSYYLGIDKGDGHVIAQRSPSVDCALMMNLFGSAGEPGPVIRVAARKRKGTDRSFSECIRGALSSQYGEARTVSLGGVFLVKSGRARFHIMPDFPSQDQLPFRDRGQVEEWLTYHDFAAPVVCLCVMHSADPGGKMGLRIEHTHCFSPSGEASGGHYHYDLEDEEVEYEAYFNTAKFIYRIDQPAFAMGG
ncbi:hypothetical protein B0I35DRAFT_427550 [Stachybotrys elegans]|uniref:DUF1907 domain-containing protein n=1 Tax=Stachybotrys elegans TaxID=80388 RepID=A0A8K0SUZ7_9HYPO|nr:hypothetical protein B0I35DRAFT_427550 [Stachybotrys elegans]